MNIKLRKAPFLLFLLHPLLVLAQGYFLSPEFTLYPYLYQAGLKPYLNIIDQHLPALFFGPFTLPSWLTVNPQPLLTFFLVILVATNILFYLYLLRQKVRSPKLLLALFIFASLFFSGHTLWLETFVVFFLSLILHLSLSDRPFSLLANGFLFSLALLIRPTLLPALFIFYFILHIKPDRYFFTGLALPPLIVLLYLFRFGLFDSFLQIFFTFNTADYASLAAKLPTSRQLLYLLIFLLPLSLRCWPRASRLFTFPLILFSLLPLYPRFEFIHFLPTVFFACYLLSLRRRPVNLSVGLLVVFLFSSVVYRAVKYDYGNFFLTPDVQSVSQFLQQFPGEQVYVLGGSDLIYPLSGRYPTSYLYLPSLPWYLANDYFNNLQLSALKLNSSAPVVINTQASVDGQSITQSAGPVYTYLDQNYTTIYTVGPYQVMLHQPLALNL